MAVVATLTAVAQTAAGQAKAASTGFTTGYTDIGPAVGLGNVGNASASFGGRFERAVKPLPDLWDGMLGIEASIDYYSYSSGFVGYRWRYKHMPIGVTANYHFKLDSPKIDPFFGVGLGYIVRSCSLSGISTVNDCGYSSGIYGIGRAGARYFFSPKVAAYADAGAGAATFNAGLMFKLK